MVQLLEKGTRPESEDNEEQPPLSWAVESRHGAIVQLLEKSAQIDSKDSEEQTQLSRAAGNGHEATMQLLFGNGAEVNLESEGRKLLLWAAREGYEALVRRLERGVEVNPKDGKGRTPLSWAAGNGHVAAVQLLLEQRDTAADSGDIWRNAAICLIPQLPQSGPQTRAVNTVEPGKVFNASNTRRITGIAGPITSGYQTRILT